MALSSVDSHSIQIASELNAAQTEYIVITGEVVYEALLETCWDEANTHPNVSEVICSALLLKLEIYLEKLKLSKTNWIAVQFALTAYLKKKNLVITIQMRKRLYKILDHFAKEK